MGNIKITGGQVLQNDLPVGLGGTNYVYVRGDGTASKNATELQAAYNKAKTMSPSSGNVITLVIAPGKYDFGATAFVHNTAYINLVSLTGGADVYLSSTEDGEVEWYPKIGITVTANNSLVKGINCGGLQFVIGNLPYLICENCTGGDGSFAGYGGTASGTFTNCTGDTYAFGGNGGTASGKFTNCTGGNSSFGSYGTASGKFTNCTGGTGSFGGYSTASGTFTNCTGGSSSFGGTISSTGRLYYCRLTSGTFPTPASGGKLVLCIDGNNSVVTTP